MTVEKKPDGNEPFLSRWARVKRDAESGAIPGTNSSNTSIDAPLQPKMPEEARPERTLPETSPVELPSLDSLTPQSDYSPFMAKSVDPALRNQAMKKLFTDPHYNVMDRLDTYIDDYSTHPPLPLDVIRQMSISKTLRLFDDEEEEGGGAKAEGKGSVGSVAPKLDVAVPDPNPNPSLPAPANEKLPIDANAGVKPSPG